jgi:hypothetical protein
MYDYNLVEERDVLCIDQKSFFPNAFKGPVAANTTEPCLLVSATTANFSFIGSNPSGGRERCIVYRSKKFFC